MDKNIYLKIIDWSLTQQSQNKELRVNDILNFLNDNGHKIDNKYINKNTSPQDDDISKILQTGTGSILIEVFNKPSGWFKLVSDEDIPKKLRPTDILYLKMDSIFNFIQYQGVEEARKSAKIANYIAISTLFITFITSMFSIFKCCI